MNTKKKSSGLAIAAMILGIAGLVLSCLYIGIFPCIVGLILAAVVLATKGEGKRMAVAGLVTSIVGIVVFLFVILASIGSSSSTDGNSDKQNVSSDSSESGENNDDSDNNDTTDNNDNTIEYVPDDEIKLIYTDTNKYKGKHVKLYLKLIDDPDYSADGVYFQGFADIENNDLNTIVSYADNSLVLVDNDYVYVDGEITGSYSGHNAFGGEVNAVKIVATTARKSSYAEAASPAIKTFDGIEPIEQHGCSVTIDKVEVSSSETRIYITATNNSDKEFRIYSYSSKIVQGGKQYDSTYNYKADYEKLQSGILSGVTSSGVIVFDKIDENAEFDFIIKGYNSNYSLDFEDYKFTIQ